MRDENVTVRKKVTEDMIEVQNVTTYRPVTSTQQQLVTAEVGANQFCAAPDSTTRARLQFLDAGYYTDPATGMSVYRRRGLHWVQPTVGVLVAESVPVLIPTQTETTTLVPEITQRRRPVEISRYVDSVETRKVPVEITKYVEETATRQVPVTVRKPITKISIEQIPYTETRYVEEIVMRKVPVTETEYVEVTEVEPYEVQTARWTTINQEVEVPKVIRRRVDYEVTRNVARTVMMKLPIDECGNPVGPLMPLYGTTATSTSSPWSSGYGTTAGHAPTPATSSKPISETSQSVFESPDSQAEIRYSGQLELPPKKTLDETSAKKSVAVPETEPPSIGNPRTSLKPITSDDPLTAAKSDESSVDKSNRQEFESINKLPTENPNKIVPKAGMPEDEVSDTGNEFAADPKNSGFRTELNDPK